MRENKRKDERGRSLKRRELKVTVKPPYLTGDKYVRIFLQPVEREGGMDYELYIWLAKIFGLALLAESALIAFLI